MKSKFLFLLLVGLILGGLVMSGFALFEEHPRVFYLVETLGLLIAVLLVILYRRLVRPYQLLQNATGLINGQDFTTNLRSVNNKEADQLIDVFNRMINHLKNERLLVREKNQFLDLLISASPQSLIILDFDDHITDINPAGIKLLNISNLSFVKGRLLSDIDGELAQSLAALKPGEHAVVRGSGMTTYRCIRTSFVDRGFNHPFILVEELTIELLKVEKESYENIIRIMAHEVNNSVAAIGSTLDVVSDILKQNPTDEWSGVLPAVETSFSRCGRLANFISKLAHVVKIPKPTLSDVRINQLAHAVEAFTRLECERRNITLTLALTPEDKLIHVDGIQFEQVLVNIIKNAYEAIGSNGEIQLTTSVSPLSITIADNGSGIPDDSKEKIFTPFFTTKPDGQGIGLMFIREVLLNHACRFRLTSKNGWTKFEIFFE